MTCSVNPARSLDGTYFPGGRSRRSLTSSRTVRSSTATTTGFALTTTALGMWAPRCDTLLHTCAARTATPKAGVAPWRTQSLVCCS